MKMRISELRKERNLTQVDLAAATDLLQSYIGAIESQNIKKSPSMDTLIRIAEALDVRIGELFDDARSVAIVGKVGAGTKIPLIDAYEKGDGLYTIAEPMELSGKGKVVGVEVDGDSMAPIYHKGDVLFYSRDTIGVPTEAIGAICVCEDESGNGWVKQIKPGSEPGKFHLLSLNPLSDNMFDITLKWAAPVKLAWPKQLVVRM